MSKLALAARPLTTLNRAVAWSFHSGLRKVERLPIPVISVGNLTSGGTGKTPVVQWLAERFHRHGRRPAIALRGYGGTMNPRNAMVSDGTRLLLTAPEAGDEAILHAQRVPGVPVFIGRDRVRSGLQAAELGCDLLLLDDGFQYWRLHREADLVLVEARWLLGERRLRHLQRERFAALERAHVVLLSKAPPLTPLHRDALFDEVAQHTKPGALIGALELAAQHPYLPTPTGPRRLKAEETRRPVVAFAAIADSASFFASLRDDGMNVIETIAFPDHHRYSPADVRRLNRCAGDHSGSGPLLFLTTEKDAVKLPTDDLDHPLAVLPVHARVEPEAEVMRVLQSLITSTSHAGPVAAAAV